MDKHKGKLKRDVDGGTQLIKITTYQCNPTSGVWGGGMYADLTPTLAVATRSPFFRNSTASCHNLQYFIQRQLEGITIKK